MSEGPQAPPSKAIITTAAQLVAFHQEMTGKALEIMKKKNQDYADPEKSGDPFKNFRGCEQAGLCSAEVGVMIRLGDKFSRLGNLLTKEAAVTDESFLDTSVDILNYIILLNGLRNERQSLKK